MPYQDIAQSGAMTVALFYNIPILASELDTFKEFMTGENDGYFFQWAVRNNWLQPCIKQ